MLSEVDIHLPQKFSWTLKSYNKWMKLFGISLTDPEPNHHSHVPKRSSLLRLWALAAVAIHLSIHVIAFFAAVNSLKNSSQSLGSDVTSTVLFNIGLERANVALFSFGIHLVFVINRHLNTNWKAIWQILSWVQQSSYLALNSNFYRDCRRSVIYGWIFSFGVKHQMPEITTLEN